MFCIYILHTVPLTSHEFQQSIACGGKSRKFYEVGWGAVYLSQPSYEPRLASATIRDSTKAIQADPRSTLALLPYLVGSPFLEDSFIYNKYAYIKYHHHMRSTTYHPIFLSKIDHLTIVRQAFRWRVQRSISHQRPGYRRSSRHCCQI